MKCRVSLLFVVMLGLVMTQALPAAEPVAKVPEKKIAVPVAPAAKKVDITETSPAIAVEEAEEPKQADRTKKSTTFCVEIRPGQPGAPGQVCDNQISPAGPTQQIPQHDYEIYEEPSHSPPPNNLHQPTYDQEPQNPIFVVPQGSPEILIPNDSYDPPIPQQTFLHFPQIFHQQPPATPPHSSQQVLIPSAPSNPCPSPPQQSIVFPAPGSNSYPSPPPQQTIVIPAPGSNPYPSPPPQQSIVIPSPGSNPYPTPPAQQTFVFSGPGSHPYPPPPPQQTFVFPAPGSNPYPPPPPQQTFVIPSPAPNPCPPSRPPQQSFVIPAPAPNPYPPPSPPQQTFVIPAPAPNPYPPSRPPQQTFIIPAPPSNHYTQCSCPCASAARHHSHAVLELVRSSMSPMNGESSSPNRMEIKSSSDAGSTDFVEKASSMDSGDAMSSRMESSPDSDVETVSTYRTHTKKPYGPPPPSYPSYYSSSYNHRSPYLIRCNPELYSLDTRGSAYVLGAGHGRSNNVPSTVHHTTYQSYPSSIDSYPLQQHSVQPGYSVYHQQPSVYRVGSDEQQGSKSHQYGLMSPARMLERMRANSPPSNFVKRPIMQSFPRVSEEKSSSDYHTKRSSTDEEDDDSDKDNSGVAMHEEMGKREAAKAAFDKED